MTALAEAAGTAAEQLFAAIAERPADRPVALRAVPDADPRPAAGLGRAGSSYAPLPRLHLAPALPPARRRTATGPHAHRPPTLARRLDVLRADDRSLVLEEIDEDRGPAPADDPRTVVRRLATASVEVIAGDRPAAQLTRWLAPGVLDALRSRAGLPGHATPRLCRAPACRSVRVYLLEDHVVEATAVVDDGRRVRAVAVRLETHRGAWRATALEIG